MNDTGAWGHNAEIVEGFRTPLQELESFLVAVKFKLLVLLTSISGTGDINLD